MSMDLTQVFLYLTLIYEANMSVHGSYIGVYEAYMSVHGSYMSAQWILHECL